MTPSSVSFRSAALRLAPAAWLALPLVCHFGFSWIGFNPTDDGWMQAVARRIAEGEVPHRDFIFVRPALSALLQVPLVWFGGDHTIWLSRLWGWLTLAGTAWLWSGLAFTGKPDPKLRFLLYAAAFFLCAHFFPVMAWHSLDGMLLCTVAVWLAARGTIAGLGWAFVCAGFAALCRQNLALFPPLLLLAIADPRKWRAMWYAAIPSLVYVGGLALLGGLPDFLLQLGATGGQLKQFALDRFVERPGFWGGLVAGGALALALFHPRTRQSAVAHQLAFLAPIVAGLAAAGALGWKMNTFSDYCYALLAFAGGLTAVRALLPGALAPADRLVLVAGTALAWAVTVSIGWNSPSLMSGVLLILVWRATQPPELLTAPPSRVLLAALALMVAAGVAFRHARHAWPYRDAPPDELKYDAGAVFPGAAGLRTNGRTFAVLRDLRGILAQYDERHIPYAVLTDLSAVWIRSPQRNPLPCEWPQVTELGNNPKLIGRVTTALRQLPPGTRIIVQRALISELGYVLAGAPARLDYFPVQTWLHDHGRKLEETLFFEIYAPPDPE